MPPSERPTPEDMEIVRKTAVLLVAAACYAASYVTTDDAETRCAAAFHDAEVFVSAAERMGYGPAAIIGAMG